MTTRSRLLFLALAGSFLLPISTAYAEPGESCGEAITGTVPLVEGYCDIYARQLEYKKSAKALRDSLEARRKSYEEPRIEALELYRENLEALFKQESKEYQEELAALEAQELSDMEDDAPEEMDGEEHASAESMTEEEMSEDEAMPGEEGEDMADADMSDDDGDGVKEKVVEDGEEGVKKKVIMPDDAPDFEGSPFE